MPTLALGICEFHNIGHVEYSSVAITTPLKCPITLTDTYRLKCADLSRIRLPLTTTS